MKLKKLIINNIASIEHAEIDFDAAPLAGEHLFLITGETGSGKSTIIDCLCLALYGDTPRLNAAKGSDYSPTRQEESNHDNLRTNDVRQLLRRGAVSADIILTFDDNNGTPFKATWHVHRAHKKLENNILKPQRTLSTEDTPGLCLMYEGSKEINPFVTELIGLDMDQFFRTVVLAQGKFSEFLNSGESEKADLLEKMTGTGIYAEVGAKIYQTCKAKENERNLLREQLKNITLLNDEEKDIINQEIAQLKSQQTLQQQQRDGAKKMSDWIDEKARNEKSLTEKKTALDEKKALTQLEKYKQEVAMINDWDTTTDARQELKAMFDAKRQLEELERERPAMQQEYDRLCAALRATIADLEEKQKALDDTNDYLKQEKPNQEMYYAIDTIKSVMERRQTASLNINEFGEALRIEEGRLPQAKEKVTQADEASKAINQALKLTQEEYNGLHIDQVLTRKDEFITTKQKLINFKNALDAFTLAQQALEKLKQDLCSQQDQLERAQTAFRDKRTLMDKAHLAVERQKDWNALIEQAHKTLHKGDQCPVCGNVISTLLAPKAQSELDQLQAEYEQAKHTVIDAEAEINAAKQLITRLNNQIEQDKTALKGKADEYDRQWEQVLVGLDKCGKALDKTSSADQIQALLDEMDNEVATLNATIQQAQTLNKRLEQQHNESAKATEAHNKAQIELNIINSSIDKQRDAVTTSKKQFNELTAELDNLMVFSDWQERAQNAEFMNELERQAIDYKAKEREAQQLGHAIELINSQLPAIKTAKDNIKGFDDNGHVLTYMPEGLNELWNTLENKCLKWNTRMDTEQHNVDRAKQTLEDFLSQHSTMTMEKLIVISHNSPALIRDIKQAHQALADAITLIQGEVQALTKHQEEIAAKKPQFPEENSERLATIIEEAGKLIEKLTDDIANRTTQLKLDEENVRLVGEKKEALEKAEAIYTQWADFNNMLGDSTGSKFRKIAQSYILGELLHSANRYLRQFNNRYELEANPGTLVILVRDLLQGDLTSANTLSGGECFMVSLALALALSSTTGKMFSVDTLFIDEGFGSLSPNYLDNVMETLNRLYDMGGRRVGIISHVEMLKERVTTQIRVERDPKNNTVSRVITVS